MSLPASSGCSLVAGSGRTLVGAGVAVAGVEEGPMEAGDTLAEALADAPADALANVVAEDDDACAVRGAYFSCPVRAELALSSFPVSRAGVLACFSGWFSLFTLSVLRWSVSTLPTREIPEGAWETVGSCIIETDGRSSPLILDAR